MSFQELSKDVDLDGWVSDQITNTETTKVTNMWQKWNLVIYCQCGKNYNSNYVPE